MPGQVRKQLKQIAQIGWHPGPFTEGLRTVEGSTYSPVRRGIVVSVGRIGWAVALLLAAWACSGSPTMPSLPVGPWGGDHISLTVSAASTHVEFDCASGDIPGPITVDARNDFDISGTITREYGGPITEPPPPPDQHPAAYSGSVNGDTMLLTVQLTDSQTLIGIFTLTRGSPGRLVRCVLPLTARLAPRGVGPWKMIDLWQYTPGPPAGRRDASSELPRLRARDRDLTPRLVADVRTTNKCEHGSPL